MKRKTASKALSLLLTLCMVLGLLPGMTLTASAEEGTHDHSSSEWTALTASGGYPVSGNYYLSDDLTLTNNLIINGQNVTICLNGNVLKGKSNDYSVIQVKNGGRLTICDCGNTVHKGYLNSEGLWKAGESVPDGCTPYDLTGGVITGGNPGMYGEGGGVNAASGTTVTFTGGNIAGNTAGYGGGVYNQGTLNLNGGKIVGNKSLYNGGGVSNIAGTVNMSGGAISYNTTDSGNNGNKGGGVYSESTFTMSGGTISHNYVNGTGGGVYISYGKQASIANGTITHNAATASAAGVYCNTINFTLSGTVNISENEIHLGTGGRSNLYLNQSSSSNVIIPLTSALNADSHIGISGSNLYRFAQGSYGLDLEPWKNSFFADDRTKMVEVEKGSYSYLKLVDNPYPYTVTFEANGGGGTMASQNIAGGSYILPDCKFTAPDGKLFAGWALTAEGTAINTTTITVNQNITLYAIWRDPIPVSIRNSGYPYGDNMTSGSITLVMDAAGDGVTYQWQAADSENGEYSNIDGATSGTYTFTPTSGKWYRCVVSGTPSKAVMAVKPSVGTWTRPYSSWYLSNGTMAYTAYITLNTYFDVVGLYQKGSKDYMLSASNGEWKMYSYTDAEPYAGNTISATLDALKVSFSETDAYTLNFEADLAEGQQAFAIGCDTELGNNDTSGAYYNTGALKAMVKNGTLSQIAMVGAESFENATDTDPAFVIKPLDPASRFWIGNYYSRETYAYNTFGGDATETVGGQKAVTLVKNTNSGMTMSWMNVPSGGSVKFQFRVGSVANVNGGVDYVTECLTGLEAGATYTITVGETSYNLTADENGKIPLSGQTYDFIGQKITIQKSGEAASREITVDARPAAPDRPTALSLTAAEKPEDLLYGVEVSEVSETSVTISPKAGQEYYYSTDGTSWNRIDGTQVTGLSGDSVQIKTRKAATKFDLASEFSAPVTVALKPMVTASASGYSVPYDGNPHSITVTAPEGATIQYSASYMGNYGDSNPSYTAAGTYRVFYRVTKADCYPAYGYAVVTITKKPVTAVLTVAEKTYDGTTGATVTAAVNSSDLIEGDSISITGLTGTFDNANAVENKTVTVNSSGKSITGTGADNYAVTIPDSATGKINPKPITVTADAKTKTYGDADPVLTYTVNDDGLVGSDTLTGALARAAGTDVGTYAIGLGTLANSNYDITFVGANLEITKRVITPTVTMEDYGYGTTPSTPAINADKGDGAVTYYYSTYSDIVTNPDHRIVWDSMTETPLQTGTYYMVAHVAGTNNCTEGTTALITFKVTPSSYEEPTAPAVDGFTVTIHEADRAKKLEYSLDGANWVAVPKLSSSGSFELTGLAENTNYTVYLRQKASADGNYAASGSVSASFTTPTRYSVAYNANYGTGTVPASVTQNSGSSVTVASGSGLRRTGYTFSGWNTQANGSGTAYAAGDTINTGATLYAQWTANSYTVKFNANGGAGTMADQGLTYDAAPAALSPNSFTKDGYHFAGWATSAGGAVVYANQQSVNNLASSSSVTLYAVWTQNRYGISGTITSDSNGDVTVKLMHGKTQVVSSPSVSMTGSGAPYTGAYNFSDIPAGTYNIVATQVVSGKTRTVTVLVVVTDNIADKDITMPSGDTNSVLDVKEDTRPVVVGGLDGEASTKAETGKSVTVTMTVEKQEEQQLPHTASQAEQQTQEAIAAIIAEASGKTLEFMDIAVKKDVTVGSNTTTEKLTRTNTVMEIVIPYDMAGKNNITVYRYHDGVAEAFTESTAKTDGTFYLDRENNLIYVYAQKFSTYAIGYTVPSSGGGYISYPITLPDSSPDGGKISVSPKYAPKDSTVTITVAPDDGYALDQLTVKDKNGKEIAVTAKGDGKYTFKMPASKVTVEVTFKSAKWNTGYVGCSKENTCPIWPYTDAKTTDLYHDGVHFCLENGLMIGFGNGIFKPNATTTRAMLIVMLWHLNGSPVVNYALDFEDVEEGTWYTEAVRWAKSEGVAGGYGNGKFGPNDTLTREQMAVMLYRYAQYKGYDVSVGEDTNILSFGDVTAVAEYAIPAMQWACGSGMVGGKDAADGSGLILDPKGSITRAQMATMVMRFCTEIVK